MNSKTGYVTAMAGMNIDFIQSTLCCFADCLAYYLEKQGGHFKKLLWN